LGRNENAAERKMKKLDSENPTVLRPAPALITKTLVGLGLFAFCLVATLCLDPFGHRTPGLTAMTVSGTRDIRAVLNQLSDELRSGHRVYVGTGDATHFVRTTPNELQQGNAVRIYPATETGFVTYFVDPCDHTLKRAASDSPKREVLAAGVTNSQAFFAEDYLGHTVSGFRSGRTIRMTLDLQTPDSLSRLVPSAGSQFCRLQAKVTRRTLAD
jgi:hypothetical protein